MTHDEALGGAHANRKRPYDPCEKWNGQSHNLWPWLTPCCFSPRPAHPGEAHAYLEVYVGGYSYWGQPHHWRNWTCELCMFEEETRCEAEATKHRMSLAKVEILPRTCDSCGTIGPYKTRPKYQIIGDRSRRFSRREEVVVLNGNYCTACRRLIGRLRGKNNDLIDALALLRTLTKTIREIRHANQDHGTAS